MSNDKKVCCPVCDGAGTVTAVPRCPLTHKGQTLSCFTNSACTTTHCRSLGMRLTQTCPPEKGKKS